MNRNFEARVNRVQKGNGRTSGRFADRAKTEAEGALTAPSATVLPGDDAAVRISPTSAPRSDDDQRAHAGDVFGAAVAAAYAEKNTDVLYDLSPHDTDHDRSAHPDDDLYLRDAARILSNHLNDADVDDQEMIRRLADLVAGSGRPHPMRDTAPPGDVNAMEAAMADAKDHRRKKRRAFRRKFGDATTGPAPDMQVIAGGLAQDGRVAPGVREERQWNGRVTYTAFDGTGSWARYADRQLAMDAYRAFADDITNDSRDS